MPFPSPHRSRAPRCRIGQRCERTAGDPYRTRLWRRFQGVLVYIVNGLTVRNEIDIDYVAGGHGYVYNYIPVGEVWIDNDVSPEERPYVLLHELVEMQLMRDYGMEYDQAHEEANGVEQNARQRPDLLDLMIRQAAGRIGRYHGRHWVEESGGRERRRAHGR